MKKVETKELVIHTISTFISLIVIPVLSLAIFFKVVGAVNGFEVTWLKAIKAGALLRFMFYGIVNMVKGDISE